MDRYRDRTDSSTYQRDEPVGVGPEAGDSNYDGWIWIPERLFARMQHIARAYELHVLSRLDPYDRNVLGREQTETLVDEIEFISEILQDEALTGELQRFRGVALHVARQPMRISLIVEGP